MAGVLPTKEAARFVAPGATRNVPVTAMNLSVGPANNSPLLVADPTDGRFVVMANRLDGPDFSCALQLSGDGGHSWVEAAPITKLPKGAEKCYGPEVAFDGNGVLHYLFVGLAGRGNEPMGVFLTTSKDRARTFSGPRQVLGPLRFGVRMAVDPNQGDGGRMHLVWLEATSNPPSGGFGPPPNPIMASYSDDGGRTFSTPVRVNDPTRPLVVAPALALGPDRRVHVAYYDLVEDEVDYRGLDGPVWDGTWSIVMHNSGDGGRRFGPGVVVESKVVPYERVMLVFTMPPPSVVAGPDRVCVAWTDGRAGDPDAFSRCSSDGRRWEGPPRRMNDDRRDNGLSQYLPRLALAPGGRLDAVFFDRRDDPANLFNEVYYTFSNDGGSSFAPNVKLTRESFDSRIGQRYLNPSARGLVEFGARLGLLSRRSEVVAAWPDTRNSRTGTTEQDLFAAVVSAPAATDSRQVQRLIGAGLMAAGAVAIYAGRRWWRPSSSDVQRTERGPTL